MADAVGQPGLEGHVADPRGSDLTVGAFRFCRVRTAADRLAANPLQFSVTIRLTLRGVGDLNP